MRVAREAMGSEGQVVPQQWLAHTTAPHVGTQVRRRLDLVVYGALSSGGAQCCDATLVSPLARSGHPQPCAAAVDGAVLRVAERRKRAAYPELARGGPQTLVVLGSEVGGRWNAQARNFVREQRDFFGRRKKACEKKRTGPRCRSRSDACTASTGTRVGRPAEASGPGLRDQFVRNLVRFRAFRGI